MKKIIFYAVLLSVAFTWSACKKGSNYPGGQISPYIPLFDLRNIYKGTDVTLTTQVMFGSDKISGIVVSEFAGGNMLPGMLMVQDKRRLSQLRGIAIPIGADAANYVSGDSVIVNVVGGTLTRANGMLQITGVPASNVSKVSSGNAIASNRVASSSILADPSRYESTLVAIVKGSFDPIPTPTDKYAGDKVVNDSFDNITLHTEAGATFANTALPVLANFTGVVVNTAGADGKLTPQVRMRKATDVQILSSTVEVTPMVISGLINDVIGGDGNYEYVQLLATQDINFAATPYSIVVCNNAGAATPAGYPVNGWASGGGTATTIQFKSYKVNITSGTAAKGTYFYVGGTTKTINGSGSTSMAASNWVKTFNVTTTDGEGFGARYTGWMANSGNAWGIAVFQGTTVTKDTQPIDCIFMSTGGSLFQTSPLAGYKIANTDWYDIVNPITLASQPYYRQGSNTLALSYSTADLGYFYKLGGVYNARLGKWVKARVNQTIILSKTSSVDEIEKEFPITTPDKPGIMPTTLKN